MPHIDAALHTFTSDTFQSVVNEAITFLSATNSYQLPVTESFPGSGVYALYYMGNFKPYRKLKELNATQRVMPIYVGKAVPPGWRTARVNQPNDATLFRRLNEHARSIDQTTNLDVNDFHFRFMVLPGEVSDLVVPVEAELIRRFRPLWNSGVDGFGNHDPGSGRYDQAVSEWDILHPGRCWVSKLTGVTPTSDAILQKIKKILLTY